MELTTACRLRGHCLRRRPLRPCRPLRSAPPAAPAPLVAVSPPSGQPDRWSSRFLAELLLARNSRVLRGGCFGRGAGPTRIFPRVFTLDGLRCAEGSRVELCSRLQPLVGGQGTCSVRIYFVAWGLPRGGEAGLLRAGDRPSVKCLEGLAPVLLVEHVVSLLFAYDGLPRSVHCVPLHGPLGLDVGSCSGGNGYRVGAGVGMFGTGCGGCGPCRWAVGRGAC